MCQPVPAPGLLSCRLRLLLPAIGWCPRSDDSQPGDLIHEHHPVQVTAAELSGRALHVLPAGPVDDEKDDPSPDGDELGDVEGPPPRRRARRA
jgi:hypothetical protein